MQHVKDILCAVRWLDLLSVRFLAWEVKRVIVADSRCTCCLHGIPAYVGDFSSQVNREKCCAPLSFIMPEMSSNLAAAYSISRMLRSTQVPLQDWHVVCRDNYEVMLVSPRNYFLYTPLLPAVATGTVEQRSIVEPVRKILGKKVSSYTFSKLACIFLSTPDTRPAKAASQ